MTGSWWSRIFPWGRGGDNRKVGIQTTKQEYNSNGISFDSAMSVSAYWACVRLLSEVVASMPLRCFRVDLEEGTKEKIFDYPLYVLLSTQPNRYQSPVEFWEQVMLNLTCYGNTYCAVQSDSSGEIFSIYPLVSSQMQVRLLNDGSVTYEYDSADGTKKVFAEESIWHIKLFGNGIVGLAPLTYAANALGMAQTLESRMSNLSANGGKSNGILMVDEVLSDKQRAAVKANFAGLTSGNDAQLFVLEAEMKYQQTSLSPTDMQLIENRKFQVEDIARFMGVPSVLINDTTATTTWGSGIEQIAQGFYKLNLRPYLERIESSMKRWLIDKDDWNTIEIEFDFDQLLRSDMKTRVQTATDAINKGLWTPNEGRKVEGLKPLDGGDKLYMNGSNQPIETLGVEDDDNGGSDGA